MSWKQQSAYIVIDMRRNFDEKLLKKEGYSIVEYVENVIAVLKKEVLN